MELHHRVELMDTLLEEAAQKRTALTHALHANEGAEQEQASTHGAPLTDEEASLQYEYDLWQKAESGLAAMRTILAELEQLERQRGLSQ